MPRFAVLLLVLATLPITACTSLGRLENDVAVESHKSVFVIGVKPDNYRISVFQGEIKDGAFKQNPWAAATIYDAARDGYVMGKADGGDTLAITYIRVVSGKDDLLGADVWPCGGQPTLVFKAQPGKVIYVTDVTFVPEEDGLRMDFTDNLKAARNYVDSNFPNLSNRLEAGSYEVLPVNDSCTRTIYVPVPRY